jgi:glycosyltransferase involved in cell wall biosynthesis
MRVAAVIPALDEAASLPGVLAALRSAPGGDRLRIVVADNGSSDGTSEVARDLGAEVVWAPRRGYGTAVQAGLNVLRAAPPEVVLIVDADLADPVERWPELVAPIAGDRADLVLSDRTTLAEPGALTPVQQFGNALATRLIAAAVGHRYADLGPFRAARWSSLARLGMEDPTWGWNVEMQLKAVRAGLRVAELPLPYRRRERGVSKVSGSLRGAARAGVRIVWAVGHYARAPLPRV